MIQIVGKGFNNIFKLEVARCKLGRPHFDSWIDGVKCIKPPAKKPKYLLSDAGPDSHESNELVLGYNRSEMPNRGIGWARCFVGISNITAILTGLTACKVNRYDLIRAPSAFRRLCI